MMDEDRGHIIKEGADYLFGIPSDWKHKEFSDKKTMFKDADENYMVFLEALIAYTNGGKRDTWPKSSSNSEEQIIEDWLDTENKEEKDDYDVCTRVDLSRTLMGSVGEEDDSDPDLKMFLQNLKPCRFSYVLEISIGNITKQRKYEDVDEFEQPDESRKKELNCRRDQLIKELKYLDNEMRTISPTYQAKNTKCAQRKSRYSSSTNSIRKASYKEKNEIPAPRRSSRKVVRKVVVENSSSDESQEEEIQPQRHVFSRNLPKRCEPLNESPPEKHSKGKKEKERVQTPLPVYCDETYLEFLSNFKMIGEFPAYTDKNGNNHMYEQCTDEGTSDSDVEVLVSKPGMKRLQSSESNSLIPKPSKKNHLLPVDIDPSSEYRKMLMDILLKPYDQNEHRNLLKEAKHRKPVIHHRDMRGENCSYPDEVLVAKSYLDRYRDLNMAVEEVQPDEPHKVLHLLRGLFFYLQYVCIEHSFMPWNDKSWMEAVRNSKHH